MNRVPIFKDTVSESVSSSAPPCGWFACDLWKPCKVQGITHFRSFWTSVTFMVWTMFTATNMFGCLLWTISIGRENHKLDGFLLAGRDLGPMPKRGAPFERLAVRSTFSFPHLSFGGRLFVLGSPVVPFCRFLGEGSPTKID